eukprot:scaffold2019_cov316-Prasinococcus_capsulatus_cf.AAC.4
MECIAITTPYMFPVVQGAVPLRIRPEVVHKPYNERRDTPSQKYEHNNCQSKTRLRKQSQTSRVDDTRHCHLKIEVLHKVAKLLVRVQPVYVELLLTFRPLLFVRARVRTCWASRHLRPPPLRAHQEGHDGQERPDVPCSHIVTVYHQDYSRRGLMS